MVKPKNIRLGYLGASLIPSSGLSIYTADVLGSLRISKDIFGTTYIHMFSICMIHVCIDIIKP